MTLSWTLELDWIIGWNHHIIVNKIRLDWTGLDKIKINHLSRTYAEYFSILKRLFISLADLLGILSFISVYINYILNHFILFNHWYWLKKKNKNWIYIHTKLLKCLAICENWLINLTQVHGDDLSGVCLAICMNKHWKLS